MNIEPKLQAIEQEYIEVGNKLSDPAIAANPKSISEAKELIKSGDSELETLAREELSNLEPKIENFTRDLTLLLLPQDPNDEKSVVVEIRAGTGGDEATLFAADLFRMYVRFCERQHWKIEIIDSSTNTAGIGGYKEIIFRIDSKGAYSKMKYESGVHRVRGYCCRYA